MNNQSNVEWGVTTVPLAGRRSEPGTGSMSTLTQRQLRDVEGKSSQGEEEGGGTTPSLCLAACLPPCLGRIP